MPRGNSRKQVSDEETPQAAQPQPDNPALVAVRDQLLDGIDGQIDTIIHRHGDRTIREALARAEREIREQGELAIRGLIDALQRRYEATIENNTLIIKIELK